jgi:HPt (histidine-containing phosphotransfer) domain-containing protein
MEAPPGSYMPASSWLAPDSAPPGQNCTPMSASLSHPNPAIESLPLLDVDGALALLGGNTTLYARVADGYRKRLPDFSQQMAELLAQAKLEPARASLHTAKGLALTVGAQRLAEVCRHGERHLRSALESTQTVPAAELKLLQQALQTCVDQTSAALDAALPRLMR